MPLQWADIAKRNLLCPSCWANLAVACVGTHTLSRTCTHIHSFIFTWLSAVFFCISFLFWAFSASCLVPLMSFIACLVTCHPLPLLFSLPSLCLYCPTLPLLFCFAHFQPLVTRCLVFLQIFDIHNGLPQSGRGPSQVSYLSGPWIARYDFGACSAWYIREEP